MTSSRQREANRANALKSTGPRTLKGKARSSRNAMQHGLSSRTIVLEGECESDFELLQQSVMDEVAPRSRLEQELAMQLAGLLWRLRRMERLETEVLAACAELNRLDDDRTPAACLAMAQDRKVSGLDGADLDVEYDQGEFEGCGLPKVAPEPGNSSPIKLPILGRAFIRDAGDAAAVERLSRHETRLRRNLARVIQDLCRARLGLCLPGAHRPGS